MKDKHWRAFLRTRGARMYRNEIREREDEIQSLNAHCLYSGNKSHNATIDAKMLSLAMTNNSLAIETDSYFKRIRENEKQNKRGRR